MNKLMINNNKIMLDGLELAGIKSIKIESREDRRFKLSLEMVVDMPAANEEELIDN